MKRLKSIIILLFFVFPTCVSNGGICDYLMQGSNGLPAIVCWDGTIVEQKIKCKRLKSKKHKLTTKQLYKKVKEKPLWDFEYNQGP